MEEHFLPVPGFESYLVSDAGRIYSEHSEGYLMGSNRGRGVGIVLQLWSDDLETSRWVYLHRLVAELHHEGYSSKHQVAAINEDLTDCRVENLYVTPKGVKGKNVR